uniref:Transposase n=1 Tax=Haemonchus placei TaxID=6290 RepID=A0A0N4X7S1_HAEPC
LNPPVMRHKTTAQIGLSALCYLVACGARFQCIIADT